MIFPQATGTEYKTVEKREYHWEASFTGIYCQLMYLSAAVWLMPTGFDGAYQVELFMVSYVFIQPLSLLQLAYHNIMDNASWFKLFFLILNPSFPIKNYNPEQTNY